MLSERANPAPDVRGTTRDQHADTGGISMRDWMALRRRAGHAPLLTARVPAPACWQPGSKPVAGSVRGRTPLPPSEPPRPTGGRPRVLDRVVLAGILLPAASGRWPAGCGRRRLGKQRACWRRLVERQQAGWGCRQQPGSGCLGRESSPASPPRHRRSLWLGRSQWTVGVPSRAWLRVAAACRCAPSGGRGVRCGLQGLTTR